MPPRLALFLLLASFFLGANTSYGQRQATHQTLYWARYQDTYNLNSRLSWLNEIETRRFFQDNKRQQFMMVSRVAFEPNSRYSFTGALAYFNTLSQEPSTSLAHAIPEIRPYQDLSINQQVVKNIELSGRIRLDERFIKNNFSGYGKSTSFVFRHRYRAQVTYTIERYNLSLKAADELFVNTGNHDLFHKLEQNRIYFFVEKRLSPAVSIEAGYISSHQSTLKPNTYVDRDIFRLTFMHTWQRKS
jgi:hypothetical protein